MGSWRQAGLPSYRSNGNIGNAKWGKESADLETLETQSHTKSDVETLDTQSPTRNSMVQKSLNYNHCNLRALQSDMETHGDGCGRVGIRPSAMIP